MHDFQRSPWHVDTWRVEPMLHRLVGLERTINLEPKVMQVLICLAQSANHVVSHEVLLATVWANTVVHPKVLSRAISELRKAFSDDRHHPQFIETIPKQGYRLIAPIHIPPPASTPLVRRPIAFQKRRLVTLSFGLIALLLAAWWYLPKEAIDARSSPIPITSYPGPEMYPALSPDGQRLAFSWQAPEASSMHLYVKPTQTETVLQLTNGPAHDLAPAWSSDGNTLAFFRHTDSTKTLYTISALGGTPRKVTTSATLLATQLSWSPDGRWLAYPEAHDTTGQLHIVALSLASRQTFSLTSPPTQSLGDRMPAFSPDGTELAFVQTHVEGVEDVFVVPLFEHEGHLSGGSPQQRTTDASNLAGLAWLPATRNLVFASTRHGLSQLWHHDRTTHTLTQIPTGTRTILGPTAAQTTNQLAFAERTGIVNLWHINLDAQDLTPVRIHSSTYYDGQPQLSPDGKTVAFVSNRNGAFELWQSEPDGTAAAPLTHFQGPYVSHPTWSPDGRFLAFAVHTSAGATLYTLNIATGAKQPWTSGSTHNLHPTWALDTNTLFFSSNRSGTWEVWYMAGANSSAQPLTQNGGYAPQLSADGTHLYYTKYGEPGLWHRDLRSEREEPLIPDLSWYDWGAWALAPHGIYMLDRRSPTGPTLVFFDFATQQAQHLTTLRGHVLSNQRLFTRSADGASLYLSLLENVSSDIMLISL